MNTKYSRRDILEFAGKIGLAANASAVSSLFRGWFPADITSTIDKVSGYAKSIQKGSDATRKAMEDFSPEQEYYIGRTVSAVVLSRYNPYDNQQATHYINTVGQTLSQASDLPETFNGYHMLILDSQDINAFASPAGHIFVTRGMLHCCQNEAELAAVLAHEIGHVQLKHGIQSIEKGRITQAVAIIGLEATKTFADSDIASLTETFEDSINDIATTMINNGYSRAFEEEADAAAVTILRRVGYAPNSLIDMLKVMDDKLKPGGIDFAKTHPSPKSRIDYISEIISTKEMPTITESQRERFTSALHNV